MVILFKKINIVLPKLIAEICKYNQQTKSDAAINTSGWMITQILNRGSGNGCFKALGES